MDEAYMKKNNGITLIDSLIALAISGILFGAAIPSLHSFWAKHQSRIAVNEITRLINFARVHAISTGQYVALCPRSDTFECGSDWSEGIQVFIDNDKNGKIEEEQTPMRMIDHFPKDTLITWRSFGGKKRLRFEPSGSTYLGNGTFTYCHPNKDPRYANQIIINYIGRLRFAEDSNNDGIKENSDGDNLECGS